MIAPHAVGGARGMKKGFTHQSRWCCRRWRWCRWGGSFWPRVWSRRRRPRRLRPPVFLRHRPCWTPTCGTPPSPTCSRRAHQQQTERELRNECARAARCDDEDRCAAALAVDQSSANDRAGRERTHPRAQPHAPDGVATTRRAPLRTFATA